MKKKILAAVLAAAMVMSMTGVSAAAKSKEKSEGTTFVYGTTGYSEEMGDAGLNPHDNYSGWSCLRYGVGETLFKYNDNMEVEPWLATDYEFTDDNTVKITLRDGVKFSSGRTMDGEAVKECLEDLIANHDRAPYDMKIDKIEADGMTVTIHTSEPCPALINYLGDPYGAIIDMDYGVQGEGGSANVAGTGPYVATEVSPTEIKLVKNEDYWGGDVKVDNVIVKSFSDGSALTAALQTGDIQGTYGLQYDNYALFDGNPDYQISSVATSRCFFGQFNMKSELMQDQNVRKAIEMGIDKDGFCSVIMEGRGVPAVGAFPSSFWPSFWAWACFWRWGYSCGIWNGWKSAAGSWLPGPSACWGLRWCWARLNSARPTGSPWAVYPSSPRRSPRSAIFLQAPPRWNGCSAAGTWRCLSCSPACASACWG